MIGPASTSSREGAQFQVSWLPEVGDDTASDAVGAGADDAKLIWSPSTPTTSGTKAEAPSAIEEVAGAKTMTAGHCSFFRRWSAHEMQEDALEMLWRTGDIHAAEEQLTRMKRKRPLSIMSLAEYAGLGAGLTAAIIANRRDLTQAHRSLSARGLPVTLNMLQRFYYTQFRRSAEGVQLVTAMEAEMETDDGLEDHCAICLNPGFLICCDECSAVYHPACVKLAVVPEGDWICPSCVGSASAAKPATLAEKAPAAARASATSASAASGRRASTRRDLGRALQGKASGRTATASAGAPSIAGRLVESFRWSGASRRVHRAATAQPERLGRGAFSDGASACSNCRPPAAADAVQHGVAASSALLDKLRAHPADHATGSDAEGDDAAACPAGAREPGRGPAARRGAGDGHLHAADGPRLPHQRGCELHAGGWKGSVAMNRTHRCGTAGRAAASPDVTCDVRTPSASPNVTVHRHPVGSSVPQDRDRPIHLFNHK